MRGIGHRSKLAFGVFFLIFIITIYEICPNCLFLQDEGWIPLRLDTTSTDNAEETIPCVPRKNIVFLKTHKTASTSVQNILMRYAYRKNLTLLFPKHPKEHRFSLVRPFRKEMAAGAPWEDLGYNIVCHHMVFNKPEIKKLMPNNSLYISIVRNPVSLFESLYEYHLMEEFYQMDIEEYARATKIASAIPNVMRRSNGMGRNNLLYDFGVHPKHFDNITAVRRAIENIEMSFDFVMVAEHFDESVVLLRHKLCWDLDDVISLASNARMGNYKKNLTAEAYNNLVDWNWSDMLLYDRFLKKFNETVNEFGRERIQAEVLELRARRNEWFEHCIEKEVHGKELTSYSLWSKKVSGYLLKNGVKNITCEDLVKPEYDFTMEVRQRQLKESNFKKAMLDYVPRLFR